MSRAKLKSGLDYHYDRSQSRSQYFFIALGLIYQRCCGIITIILSLIIVISRVYQNIAITVLRLAFYKFSLEISTFFRKFSSKKSWPTLLQSVNAPPGNWERHALLDLICVLPYCLIMPIYALLITKFWKKTIIICLLWLYKVFIIQRGRITASNPYWI